MFVTQDVEATRGCDRIFVVSKGSVVAAGPFEELSATSLAVRRLAAVRGAASGVAGR